MHERLELLTLTQVLRSAAGLANRNPKQVLFQDLRMCGLGIDDLEGNVERLLNELQSAKQELRSGARSPEGKLP